MDHVPLRGSAAEFLSLAAYVLAAVSGGIGGCGVASSQFLRARGALALRVAYVFAYAVIGAIGGMLFVAYVQIFEGGVHMLADAVPGALISGMVFSTALAGTNIAARVILKRLGIQIELTVRHADEDRRE